MPIIINTARKPEPPAPRDKAPDGGEQHAHAPKWVTALIELSIIALAIVLAFVVRENIYDIAVVTSRSMLPTLEVGDRVVFDHRQSLYGQWQRGDIIFFDPPETWQDTEKTVLVKRLIGLPGETVAVRGGHVRINGQEIEAGTQADPTDNVSARTLADDEYFVLGDNRNNSDDSRSHGPIKRDDIRGRGVLLLWPLSHAGHLAHWPAAR